MTLVPSTVLGVNTDLGHPGGCDLISLFESLIVIKKNTFMIQFFFHDLNLSLAFNTYGTMNHE